MGHVLVYVYICTCVYVYLCICVYVYLCICVFGVYMCTCVRVYVCMCVYVYMSPQGSEPPLDPPPIQMRPKILPTRGLKGDSMHLYV